MDFRSLTYFVTVAREQNITRAATLLNMSQPPLSSQIRQLEANLGTELFHRSKQGLTLTPTGEILYKRARQILELASQTREEIGNFEEKLSGELKIGVVEGRAPYLVSRWVAGFREEFPLVTYTLRSGSTDDLLDQLMHHVIDLAVIAAPYNQEQLTGFSVGKTPWVAIIPRDHPLAVKPGDCIRLADLEREPLIIPERVSRVEAIERWFAGVGLSPQTLCKTSHYVDALSLVEQGVGVCIFPQATYTPNEHIKIKMITDPPKYAEYVMVQPQRAASSELAGAFWEYVVDFMEEDKIHSERFRTQVTEFELPEEAELL